MKFNTLAAVGLVAPATALLRFPCSSLTVQRLDPLVNPGQNPSTHLHQIVGGNSFNVSMDPASHDPAALSTCTTCQFVEDMSNYWTAVMFFKARNGSYKRVPQLGQDNNGARGGGMMVYYMSDALFDTAQKTKVTAFKTGFRMLVGDSGFSTREQARKYRQLTYTCMQNAGSRNPETLDFPKTPCPYAIMANHRFPTCWDGKNLDSPNHQDHMAYPESLTFEAGGPCPASHPVKVPQVLFETLWVTKEFNNKADWPADGSQPFVWSTGDQTGYASHADYLFGWKGDALQRNMDAKGEYMSVKALTRQNIQAGNKCEVKDMVKEQIDGWLPNLPGIGGPMIMKRE